jgi:hypothetical protein
MSTERDLLKCQTDLMEVQERRVETLQWMLVAMADAMEEIIATLPAELQASGNVARTKTVCQKIKERCK